MIYLIYSDQSNQEKIEEIKKIGNIINERRLLYPINFEFFPSIIKKIEKYPVDLIILDLIGHNESLTYDLIRSFTKSLKNSFVLSLNNPKLFIISDQATITIPSETFYPDTYIFRTYYGLLTHLEHYIDSYDKIERWLSNRLPKLNEDEAFYYMILFRRKWLIKQNPAKEEELRKHFNSDEMKIDNGLLKGNPYNFLAQLKKSINVLFNDRKFKVYKGKYFNINKLYLQYSDAFSLLITFEPRSIIDGLRNFCFDTLKILTQCDRSNKLHELIHCDKTLLTNIHKERRKKGSKFVLIDIDFDYKSISIEKDKEEIYSLLKKRRIEYLMSIKESFEEVKLLDNIRYVCSTPSYGLHLILEIDKNVGEKIFMNREIFRKNLIAPGFKYNYIINDVEIKTGQCLTHIPYFNNLVEDYTDMFIK